MLVEAACRRWEREHNGRVWLAWHVAALGRAKKLPDIKKLYARETSKPRQTWQQQLKVFSDWALKHNAALDRKKAKGLTNGG